MRGLFEMAFLRAFAELERREARKRKDSVCSVCRTYGGETCGRRNCRKCRKERKNGTER